MGSDGLMVKPSVSGRTVVRPAARNVLRSPRDPGRSTKLLILLRCQNCAGSSALLPAVITPSAQRVRSSTRFHFCVRDHLCLDQICPRTQNNIAPPLKITRFPSKQLRRTSADGVAQIVAVRFSPRIYLCLHDAAVEIAATSDAIHVATQNKHGEIAEQYRLKEK